MRKLFASTLAAGMVAGGALAGAAVASSSHTQATAKPTAAMTKDNDVSKDRTSADRHGSADPKSDQSSSVDTSRDA
jgi:hypothetical protein